MSERITENFSLPEFTASQKAKELKITNTIPPVCAARVGVLATNLLQRMIEVLTRYAGPEYTVHDDISSGYRCPALNAAVGGVATSQHTTGEASDNKFYKKHKTTGVITYFASIEVLRVLMASGLPFDQAIAYPTFVHLSLRAYGTNRRAFLYSKDYKGQKL